MRGRNHLGIQDDSFLFREIRMILQTSCILRSSSIQSTEAGRAFCGGAEVAQWRGVVHTSLGIAD